MEKRNDNSLYDFSSSKKSDISNDFDLLIHVRGAAVIFCFLERRI